MELDIPATYDAIREEDISAMIQKNAEYAGNADQLTHDTKQIVNSANTSMNQLTQSMDSISKASEETSKIIQTIDEGLSLGFVGTTVDILVYDRWCYIYQLVV